MDVPPDAGTCIRAVTRATTLRRRRARSDPRYQTYTPAALQERISGFTVEPRLSPDGWWLVGYVLDELADDADEFDVWLRRDHTPPRVGISPRPRPLVVPLDPPKTGRYFSGEQLRWFHDEDERPEPNWSAPRLGTSDTARDIP